MTPAKWQRHSETPLTVLAVWCAVDFAAAFLVSGWAVPGWLNWALYAIFFADVVVQLTLSEARWKWARQHWFDLLVLALPALRAVRCLRALRGLSKFHRAIDGANNLRTLVKFT